eukprot:SM000050S16975  [mRNA]  locus=s50:264393:266011:+ [translate_table: standard]
MSHLLRHSTNIPAATRPFDERFARQLGKWGSTRGNRAASHRCPVTALCAWGAGRPASSGSRAFAQEPAERPAERPGASRADCLQQELENSVAGRGEDGPYLSVPVPSKRTPVEGLQTDFAVLATELWQFVNMHGRPGFMPTRDELRDKNRSDLEKAIARMGGFPKVAECTGLDLAYKERKPKGYWSELSNVKAELLDFQKQYGSASEPLAMPTRKSLEAAGRYDLARALEKWGGLLEVARALGMKVRRQRKKKEQPLPDDGDEGCDSPVQFDGRELNQSRPATTVPMPQKAPVPVQSKKWVTLPK